MHLDLTKRTLIIYTAGCAVLMRPRCRLVDRVENTGNALLTERNQPKLVEETGVRKLFLPPLLTNSAPFYQIPRSIRPETNLHLIGGNQWDRNLV